MGQRVPIIKAQPTVGDVHVDTPLTQISVAYMQASMDFVSDRVFPVVPVQKQSNIFWELDREDWFRSDAKKRAPGAESAGSGYGVTQNTYYCHKYAIHKDISDDVRQNSDSALAPDRNATNFVSQQLMLLKEKTWVANYFGASIWTGESSPTNWAASGGTPIEDVGSAADDITRLTGKRPNTMVVSPEVHRELKNHADIIERIKYTQRGIVTADLLADLFEVDQYLVTYATENTAEEGDTASYSFVAGDHCLLLHVADSPGLDVPSAGYTFSWTGLLGSGALANRIKRFRLERNESDRVEGEMAFDMKVVAADLGHIFLDVTS